MSREESLLSRIISLVVCRTSVLRFGSAVLLSGLLLTACIPVHPPVTNLSPSLSWRYLGAVTAGSPVAWDSTGKRLVANADGLTLIDSDAGTRSQLTDDPALSAMAWAPDGTSIVYSIPDGADSVLRIVGVNGILRSEIRIKGACRQLFWTNDNRILAGFTAIKKYSFGISFQAGYVEWDTGRANRVITLVDTTLKPSTPVDPIERLFSFDLSPWEDEIIYSAIYDPPLFATYSTLKYRHLASGYERAVAKQPLSVAGGRFCDDGENVLYADGRDNVVKTSVWGGELQATYPSPGIQIDAPSSGPWRIVDTTLYAGEVVSGQLDESAVTRFSSSGEKVAIVEGRMLSLLEGLVAPQKKSRSTDVLKNIRLLRDLRGKQLITPDEFQQRLSKLETQ